MDAPVVNKLRVFVQPHQPDPMGRPLRPPPLPSRRLQASIPEAYLFPDPKDRVGQGNPSDVEEE